MPVSLPPMNRRAAYPKVSCRFRPLLCPPVACSVDAGVVAWVDLSFLSPAALAVTPDDRWHLRICH